MKNEDMVFYALNVGTNDSWSHVIECDGIGVWYYYTEEDGEPFGYLEMSHIADDRVFERHWFIVPTPDVDLEEEIYQQAEAFFYEESPKYEQKAS